MKKVSTIFIGLLFAFTLNIQAQEESPDDFIGSWKVFVEGTPVGDLNMVFNLTREGNIWSGVLSRDGRADTQLNKVEVEGNSFTIYWTTEEGGYDVYLFMEKTGEYKVEGSFMDLFDAFGEKINRAQNSTETSSQKYFEGSWDVLLKGTPQGDAKMIMEISNVDNQWAGKMIGGDGDPTEIGRIEVKENSITVYWVSQGYDVFMTLEKTEGNKLEGTLMDMFDASAERSQ